MMKGFLTGEYGVHVQFHVVVDEVKEVEFVITHLFVVDPKAKKKSVT